MSSSSSYKFPEAVPHGKLEKVFPNVFMVKGEVRISMMYFFSMSMSRNMVIVKQNKDDLILIHTVRLSEEGLKELDKLGRVKHIIRLAAVHGMDDAFYKDRYNAKIWAVKDTKYVDAFDVKGESYLTPDEWLTNESKNLPIDGASVTVIESKPMQDAVLLMERPEGKVLASGDSLQNMETADSYFNLLGSCVMKMMGFFKPCNVGPAWAQAVGVEKQEMERILELKFDHVLPAHGDPVIGQAWKKFGPAVQALKCKH